jgi:NAD(P)-dependent dehydrogenase (short-subunit alcohol dehydrogenase family)
MRMDVTNTRSVAAVAQVAAARPGGIDIWVNNAGIFPSVPLLKMSDSLWGEVFAVNSRGVFVGAREAARHMTAAGNGGVIVNVISTSGFRATAPGLAAHLSSKHASRGMTRQISHEHAPHGIRVLGWHPPVILRAGYGLAMSLVPQTRCDPGNPGMQRNSEELCTGSCARRAINPVRGPVPEP